MPGALSHDVPSVDLTDETYIAVPPDEVAVTFADSTAWRRWWPDLELTVFEDRGSKGLRWNVTGALTGSCEVWLEAVREGTVVHHYLRGVPARPQSTRAITRERARRVRVWKQVVFALKDELESGRPGRGLAGGPAR